MFLFLTLVFSRYNEVIFLYNNKIINSLGFAFESDLEKGSPDFKISRINPYVFSTSLDESSVTFFERFDQGNYSVFLIDLFNYDYDLFKERYFVFQGILPNTILSTPIMKSINQVFFDSSSEDSGDGIAPVFQVVGLKANFIDDLFGEDEHFFGSRISTSPILGNSNTVLEKKYFSDLINKGVPFLSGKKPDEVFDNKKVIIQNKSGVQKDEYFKEVLDDEEKKFRASFFEDKFKENEKLNASKTKNPKNFFRRIGDSFLFLFNNTNNNY